MRRLETWLIVLVTALAAPFLLVLPWLALFRMLVGLFPQAAPLYLLELPPYLVFRFLSSLPRYLGFSLAVLLSSLLVTAMVLARLRGRALRSVRLYLSLLGIVAVLAFPLWMRYRPAAEPLPGVELRQVDPPGLLQGVVKQAQVAVERGEVQYEPLGWADDKTVVYRLWRGGHYAGEQWVPGTVQGLYAYDLDTAEVVPFAGDPDTVIREFCTRAECVEPRLTAGPPLVFPGHYATTLLSPDGRWAAFTVRHTYGPEDLLVMELPETSAPGAVASGEARRPRLWPF
jgi:hypothetical protein